MIVLLHKRKGKASTPTPHTPIVEEKIMAVKNYFMSLGDTTKLKHLYSSINSNDFKYKIIFLYASKVTIAELKANGFKRINQNEWTKNGIVFDKNAASIELAKMTFGELP